MSEGLQAALGVAVVVLLALLTGALLPVLLEARATLRRLRLLLDDAGPRLTRAIDETSSVMTRMDRIVSEMEPRIHALTLSLDEAQKVMNKAVAVGGAIGPIVVAAVRGFQSACQGGEAGHESAGAQGQSGETEGE